MKFHEFLLQAEAYQKATGQRRGQALFNTLYALNPTLADSVRATDIDPFHVNERCNSFIAYVCENWRDST